VNSLQRVLLRKNLQQAFCHDLRDDFVYMWQWPSKGSPESHTTHLWAHMDIHGCFDAEKALLVVNLYDERLFGIIL
jgi:hypothetical protein